MLNYAVQSDGTEERLLSNQIASTTDHGGLAIKEQAHGLMPTRGSRIRSEKRFTTHKVRVFVQLECSTMHQKYKQPLKNFKSK